MPGVGTTHHVKIGDQYHLIRPGTYRKAAAPVFGARFTTGDPDYSLLNAWQHWVQRCWVGGFGAQDWMDDAMYHEGVGVDTSQHEVLMLARDLGPHVAFDRGAQNWDLNGESLQRFFTVFNDKLYLLQAGSATTSRLYRFDDATTTWVLVHTFVVEASWMEPFGDYLVFGTSGANLYRMTTAEAFSTIAKPSGVTARARTLKTYRGKLYVGMDRAIWRLKPDFTWDGSTAFYTAEDVNYLNQSEVHQGFLYFGSRNGHILRTDGNNTFDLWAFEPHVVIWGIRSFDGRLFVGAAENIAGTNSAQAVLYQFTGASVTELKRWGKTGIDVTTGKLRAFEGSLWFGASSLLGMANGFGVARYDPREDAYHIFASNHDTTTYPVGTENVNVAVDDVAYWKGYVFCSVRAYGVFRTPYIHQDIKQLLATFDQTRNAGGLASMNGGWITSSDFDAGTPGLMKLWDAITVHADLPVSGASIWVEYSTDGGETWTNADNIGVIKPANNTRVAKTFRLLRSSAPVTGTRIKWRLTLRTTDATRTPIVRGVVVRYLPIPEPNWRWEMTLILSESQELLDMTIDTPDVAAKLSALESAFRAQVPIQFTDLDGTQWGATTPQTLLLDMRELVPVPVASSAGVVEREIQVVLLEVKETYEEVS